MKIRGRHFTLVFAAMLVAAMMAVPAWAQEAQQEGAPDQAFSHEITADAEQGADQSDQLVQPGQPGDSASGQPVEQEAAREDAAPDSNQQAAVEPTEQAGRPDAGDSDAVNNAPADKAEDASAPSPTDAKPATQESATPATHTLKGAVATASPANASVTAVNPTIVLTQTVTANLKKTSYTYSGTACKPKATVTYGWFNPVTLTPGTDYTITYSNNKKVGTATATIKLSSEYGGQTIQKTFTIAKAGISKAKIKLSRTWFSYDGKVKTPKVTVKLGGTKLAKGTDYTVSYSKGRKALGTYKVTIKPKGGLSGKAITKTFKINPRTTSIKQLVPASKAMVVQWKARSGVVKGYQVRYSAKSSMANAKKVAVTRAANTAKVISKLSGNKTYYVQVRTYAKSHGKTFVSNWSTPKSITTYGSTSTVFKPYSTRFDFGQTAYAKKHLSYKNYSNGIAAYYVDKNNKPASVSAAIVVNPRVTTAKSEGSYVIVSPKRAGNTTLIAVSPSGKIVTQKVVVAKDWKRKNFKQSCYASVGYGQTSVSVSAKPNTTVIVRVGGATYKAKTYSSNIASVYIGKVFSKATKYTVTFKKGSYKTTKSIHPYNRMSASMGSIMSCQRVVPVTIYNITAGDTVTVKYGSETHSKYFSSGWSRYTAYFYMNNPMRYYYGCYLDCTGKNKYGEALLNTRFSWRWA